MFYNEYGKTGAKVSAAGFGGMRFDIKKRSVEENAELVKYAFDKGINYFDTAPGYCDDKSEDIFGTAIKQMKDRRNDFYISTKGFPEKFDTADKARGAVENSLKRLNVEKIDFYHVWCVRKIEHYELALKKGGQYDGLVRCRDEGLIDNIVISTHLDSAGVRGIAEEGRFEGILLGVNPLNFLYRWEGVKAAYERGLGVVAMNPLGGGLIPEFADDLGFLADGNETPVEAALRFCIGMPEITVTLVGFAEKSHIDTACRIAENCPKMGEEDLLRIKRNVSENMDRFCTSCGYCKGLCPKDVPIAEYMQFYNNKILGKQDKFLRDHIKFEHDCGPLANYSAKAGDCIQCGRCEQACTQHLDIIKRLEELEKVESAALKD